ncbi:response regulator [Dissulfurirhabdus thermomarina]|uniref:Response regulator n=1 Tax=Dissulfurirhabdus thermomarina TaxID=1765737 RepID=A0A6N9TUI0_DISTH|nr:response regulator [Dissulfurirhabdus thermomarina]NDY42166.1 response regulator [Dissulfurirhabdus thermomarina]NMX22404.1 response regulator [Dissulfurirhabdus thermomarina]
MSGKKRILVVDDEESIHLLYREELEEEGYEVSTAMSGEEALEVFDAEHPDLVVLDINMPGMDGIEVLRQMKEKKPDVPVILSSAYPEYKQDLASWASDDYIVKSFNLDELKASIRRHLAK